MTDCYLFFLGKGLTEYEAKKKDTLVASGFSVWLVGIDETVQV